MVIHLEYRLPDTSSDLPRSYGRTTLLLLPYLVLLQVGFTKLPMSPSRLVSSYLTVSPLPNQSREKISPLGRSIFCGTFLPVTGTGCYPAPCPMELGLSSRSDIKERATILSALAILIKNILCESSNPLVQLCIFFPSSPNLTSFPPPLMKSLQNITSDYRWDSS